MKKNTTAAHTSTISEEVLSSAAEAIDLNLELNPEVLAPVSTHQ